MPVHGARKFYFYFLLLFILTDSTTFIDDYYRHLLLIIQIRGSCAFTRPLPSNPDMVVGRGAIQHINMPLIQSQHTTKQFSSPSLISSTASVKSSIIILN